MSDLVKTTVREKLETIVADTRFQSSIAHQKINVLASGALTQLDEIERDVSCYADVMAVLGAGEES